MALTKKELELLHSIDNRIVLLFERQEKQADTQNRIKVEVKDLKKTVYENGLNTRVKEIHDWMIEQRKAQGELLKQNDQQEHETKLLGVKMSAELRQTIINGIISGGFVLAGIVIGR